MKFLFLVVFLAALLVINACSSVRFNSNAGVYAQKKVQDSIRKSVVKRYTNNEVWKLGGAQIGYVESDYCQRNLSDDKPDKDYLISALEVKTQKLGGNALVFDSCLVNSGMASCQTYTKCRGSAYLITY